MRKYVNARDLLLLVLSVGCVAVALKSSNDEIPGWLRGNRVALWFLQFSTGNQNLHDFAVGVFVGLVVYFLVVWWPECDKRNRVRRNLQLHYDMFREGCIREFFNAMGQGYDPAVIEKLKDRERFRQFFCETVSAGQTRWDAVANRLHAENIKSLIVEFEIFIAEVRFTLIAVDVVDRQSFAFLKRLADILYRARNSSPEYDSVKSLLRLMWSVFAGWSFVEGYTEENTIAGMIEAI
jgi:hypothetical protein